MVLVTESRFSNRTGIIGGVAKMVMELTLAQRKSQLSILRETVDAARHFQRTVNVVAGTSLQKRLALIIFHDLTNKIDSVYVLCSAGNATGPEIIARSAFENSIDLLNLYRHPRHYPTYLLYLLAEHQRKGLQAIINSPDSPYSKSILENAPSELGLTVQQMLESMKLEMARHKSMLTAEYRWPNKEKAVRDREVDTRTQHRANLAGKKHDYEAMYRMYSRPTHGEIGSMLGSFVAGGELVWPPIDPLPSSLAVDLATHMLIDSGKLLSRKLRRPITRFNLIEKRQEAWANKIYDR